MICGFLLCNPVRLFSGKHNNINSLSLSQAPRRILKEEVTVRLSSCSDIIILQTPPVPPRISLDPPYERIFLLDPQYQDPTALRNNLPELSQSAEASGIHYIHKHTLALSQSLVGCLTIFLRIITNYVARFKKNPQFKTIENLFVCSSKLHLFDQKYSKNVFTSFCRLNFFVEIFRNFLMNWKFKITIFIYLWHYKCLCCLFWSIEWLLAE